MDLCRFHSVLALALALLAPAAAQGPVVHEQLPLVGPTGAYTLAGQPPSVQRGADNFLVPATGMTLGVVEFWGIYDVWLSGPSFPLPTAPAFFDLRIFQRSSGSDAAISFENPDEKLFAR